MTYRLYTLLALLPLGALHRIAAIAALLLRWVFRYRVGTVRRNLAASFPEQAPVWHRQTLEAFYRGFVQTTVEVIRIPKMSLEDFAERVTFANTELVRTATRDFTRSAIVLTLHQGNWEWMLHGATAALGMPIDPVYKPLHDPGADRFALETRSQFGAEPIPMSESARNLLRHRRKVRLFAMVADQSPGFRERVHWTTFLNQPTAFFAGAATIARLTGHPVLFAECHRQEPGRYRVTFREVTLDPKALTEDDIIERYARLAEESIRAQPESWLWSNRRWKLQAPEATDATTESPSGDPT